MRKMKQAKIIEQFEGHFKSKKKMEEFLSFFEKKLEEEYIKGLKKGKSINRINENKHILSKQTSQRTA